MITQQYITNLGYKIIGCAIEVHQHLGPGLMERIYEDCFMHELGLRGLTATRQVSVPIEYKNLLASQPLKLDILVNDLIIVELKCVEGILPVHKAQLLSYMKLAQKPKGLLINFFTDNVTKSTIHLVNEYFSALPSA
jgi:GxxExxY protein